MAIQPVVVALGGHALQSTNTKNPLEFPNLGQSCAVLAAYADQGLVLTHGNGPQIGMLAQSQTAQDGFTLDALGAQTEGLLGYRIEQELGNRLEAGQVIASLLTCVEVDARDPAFANPAKPVGPCLDRKQAASLKNEHGWQFSEENGCYRRLVPSPRPIKLLQSRPIELLLQAGVTVICAGGGGIPVVRDETGCQRGVEAVVDKDRASALLACQLGARLLVLATDVDGVYRHWNTPEQQKILAIPARELAAMKFDRGSMGPKVEAACDFVQTTGQPAIIGALDDLDDLLTLKTGTVITS